MLCVVLCLFDNSVNTIENDGGAWIFFVAPAGLRRLHGNPFCTATFGDILAMTFASQLLLPKSLSCQQHKREARKVQGRHRSVEQASFRVASAISTLLLSTCTVIVRVRCTKCTLEHFQSAICAHSQRYTAT